VSLHDALQQLMIIVLGLIPLRALNDYGADDSERRRESR
jgi:hypothetical protein